MSTGLVLGAVAAAFVPVHAEPTYDAFPAVVRLPSHELLVTLRSGSAHVSRDGRIVLARSRDGGVTWSTRTIYDEPGVDDRAHLGLTRLRDGTLVLPFFKHDGTAPREPFLLRSRDGGRTWSAPTPLPAPGGPWRGVYGKPVELSSGTLLLATYGNERAAILRSIDGGRTWAQRATLENATETSIVPLDSRRLLALTRGAVGTGFQGIYQTRSNDRGRTWSRPRFVFPGVSPDVIRLRGGRLLACVADRGVLGILCRTSWNGRRWSAPSTLYASATTDFGYPASVAIGGGRLFTAFYGDTGDVVGVRWRAPGPAR